MPPHAYRPEALAWQVFRGSAAVRRDLLTAHQLRSSAWVRLRHDVYADARLARDHALACRAVALQLPAGSAIAGPSAAFLHGVAHAAKFTDDVHVVVPAGAGLRSQRGLRVHTAGSPQGFVPASVTMKSGAGQGGEQCLRAGHGTSGALHRRAGTHQPRDGDGATMTRADPWPATADLTSVSAAARAGSPLLPRTDPTAAAWESAVWLEPLRSVAIVDSLLGRGLTTAVALAEVAAAYAHRPGARRARWVFGLADAGAQSPPESQLRVRLVLAGIPRPVTQHPVRVPGGPVLHPDLAWPEYRVAVEYDGLWHAGREHLHRGRQRLNQLVGAGWLVLHVTSQRLYRDFPAVAREVRAALVSRGWRR
ncbi:Domain of unknown function [Micromonospora nigra]|uniref:Transcriptional regulator, AbiEi antitoxin, Type IV TA system n=1 Tax=Micromonospora nigra TaxID=145857 RepID=A0A1C6RUE5_9ACTN|nr:hypothetical protein [Micromonospora nigra]SCL20827.1 Domain of unknown function [Micromonospora nigra]